MSSTVASKSVDWQSWCEFRCATSGVKTSPGTNSASEQQFVRNLLNETLDVSEKAVWLRSLVELCGLTIRQVSGYFNIEPQVVVQAISLLEVPQGFSEPEELTKRKRRRKAA